PDTADAHAPDVRRPPLSARPLGEYWIIFWIARRQLGYEDACSSSRQVDGAVADFMSAGSLKREYNSDDDDCQILDDDASGQHVRPVLTLSALRAAAAAAFGASAAYRQLKDETGSNVFDFSLPYSAPVNMEAAKKVIDKALQITSYKPTNIAAWTKANNFYLRTVVYKNMRKEILRRGASDHLK
uniref:Rubis-subs-bind domain-containing protein n=1 Tax=Macrostomum lignano TaxID=282301 RepID=A0A1I8F4P3_9PLAT